MLDPRIQCGYKTIMTKLFTYLKANRITQSEFAKLLNVKQPTVSRLLRSGYTPSLDLALRIEKETGGEVPTASWSRDAE